ncbi:penicillin-binding protein activator [Thorsellia kenyensis]|uniref:Penicillin-binding protein activator n=1 Tax=Thorsellia kenyensis TaxID=1549888 RepID=A0ABV6C786_9GAMM
MLKNHKKTQLCLIIASSLFLASCQTNRQSQLDSPLATSSDYEPLLQQASGSDKNTILIYQAATLIQENNLVGAGKILDAIPTGLGDESYALFSLTRAELYVKEAKINEAKGLISQINTSVLNDNGLYRLAKVQMQVTEQTPSAELLRAFIGLEAVAPSQDKPQLINETWRVVANISPDEIKRFTLSANEFILQGWLELRNIYDTYRYDNNNTALFDVAVDNWKTRNPQHPAVEHFPSQFLSPGQYSASNIATTNYSQNQSNVKVALALPFSGQSQVSSFANAIKLGFETTDIVSSYQATNAETSSILNDLIGDSANTQTIVPSSTPAPIALNASLFDTQAKDINSILVEAEAAGLDTVVGPLLKNQVEQLSSYQGNLKILALNVPETLSSNPNICYFALSPEDEAIDAAERMISDGKSKPLILVPYGNLGDRVAAAFNSRWEQRTGSSAIVRTIHELNDLKVIGANGDALDINGPIRDGGVDSIYVIAEAEKWLYIKPIIDAATAGKNSVGLYASSRSHQNNSGPDFRLEMQGVKFSEIPLLANPQSLSYQTAMTLMQNDYSQVRLLAMGIDANRLAQNFGALQSGNFTMRGDTGLISVAENCEIQRKLTWLEYDKGTIIPARNP